MRITQSGVYVLIQKFGIENLISTDNNPGPVTCSKVITDVPKEQATLTVTENGVTADRKVSLFDHLTIEITAEMIEFRRSINLHYRGSLNINTMKVGKKSIQSNISNENLNQAVKSKKKRSK